MKKILFPIAFFIFFLLISSPLKNYSQGYGISFDGSYDYVMADLNTGLTNSTVTLEFWYYPLTLPSGLYYLIDLHSTTNLLFDPRKRLMIYVENGEIGFTENNNALLETLTQINYNSGFFVTTGKWYHIVLIANGSNYKMYINGEQVFDKNMAESYRLDGNEELFIATDYWGTSSASFRIDEFRFWNTVRSLTDIRNNMYKELNGNEAGLVAYYKMSNGSGTDLTDNQVGGASYNGNLYNFYFSGNSNWINSTAPLPYQTRINGNWESYSTWLDGQETPENSWSIATILHQVSVNSDAVVGTLQINAGKSLTINETHSLTVSNTVNNLAGNSGLIVNSGPTGSGNLILNSPGIRGTVKRYIGGNTSYPVHYISSPVDTAGFSCIWQNGDYNVYGYYEPLTSSNIDDGWYRVTGGRLVNGKGYALVSNATARVLNFTGEFNVPSISAPVTYSSHTPGWSTDPRGWNLVGNPFPCALNIQTFLTGNSASFYPGYLAVYFWDDPDGSLSRSQDYATYNYAGSSWHHSPAIGNPSNDPNGKIAVGQGFFVKIDTNVTALQFSASQRVISNSSQFFAPDPKPVRRFWLSGESTDNIKSGSVVNEILVAFIPGATEGIDAGFDACKLKANSALALYTIVNDSDLIIQGLPEISGKTIVRVGMDISRDGNYMIRGYNGEDFPGLNILLVDRKENTCCNLKKESGYSFFSKAGSVRDRFLLVFSSDTAFAAIQPVPETNLRAYVSGDVLHLENTMGEILKGSVVITNATGQKVFEQVLNNGSTHEDIRLNHLKGILFVSVSTQNTYRTVKVYIP